MFKSFLSLNFNPLSIWTQVIMDHEINLTPGALIEDLRYIMWQFDDSLQLDNVWLFKYLLF